MTSVDVVRSFYEAADAGAAERFVGLLHEDVVHVIPGDSPFSGSHSGREAVLANFGRMREAAGGAMRSELRTLLTDGADAVVALVKGHGERNGATMPAERVAVLYTVKDGRIVEFRDFFEDVSAMSAFWS